MVWSGALLIFGLSLCTGFPTGDQVISKLDAGPRYQYVSTAEGLRLVDLWLKTSDLEASARYNPEADNVYHLFTRSNPTVSQPLLHGFENLVQNSNFDSTKKTVVLVHGWVNTPTSDFNVHLTHAYVAAEDVNLIMTDWSIGAAADYIPAILNNIRSGNGGATLKQNKNYPIGVTVLSGEHVAKFISWLNSVTGASLSQYHIIGHSLGAHQAGVIGRLLESQVPYLTGLDPALPGWITNPHRISPDVAIYTEVIHTDAGLQGILNTAGHVDFYPNGGTNMPGCEDSNCNHHRSLFYMAESLRSGGFTGYRCNLLTEAVIQGRCEGPETLQMGGTTPNTGSTGIYFLTTNANSPFSQG